MGIGIVVGTVAVELLLLGLVYAQELVGFWEQYQEGRRERRLQRYLDKRRQLLEEQALRKYQGKLPQMSDGQLKAMCRVLQRHGKEEVGLLGGTRYWQ